ncbi:MAG: hypothetical protein BWX71_02140 [Deltaproteobacteria bacterium ADurb.Bin072]|nr:MAG: hypothetical protein BWX71_02140 [Deltaproteobacteria bacterium ADurb.Bin072]
MWMSLPRKVVFSAIHTVSLNALSRGTCSRVSDSELMRKS